MSFKEAFMSATVETKEYKNFIDGKYSATLDEVSLDQTSTPSRITFKFKVIDGDYNGRVLWRNVTLNDQGITYLKEDFSRLRIDEIPDSDEKATKLLQAKMGNVVALFVKTKPNPNKPGEVYANAYINGLKDAPKNHADGIESAVPTMDNNEEIPF
jgi:hypothetical protein